MWHEARRQEKKIRCMLVDYQRRAQRRKDYYEKIKADPTQFLQLHGRPCKIHLDPAVVVAANSSSTMMPWQGDIDNMIDRFDARAHLDIIPEVSQNITEIPVSYDERHINYERYRILVQNEFFGIPEEKYLHQIYMEEKFGSVLKNADSESSKKKSSCTAAIGYNYDEPEKSSDSQQPTKSNETVAEEEEDEESDSEDDVDLDLTLDVTKIEVAQANELNTYAHAYGMQSNDFFSFLSSDLEEVENLKLAKALEEEKAMFAGRRSRKERRAYRQRTLMNRVLSPPSYASKESSSYEMYKSLIKSKSSRSRTKSKSPGNSGEITYITSFGDDDSSLAPSKTVVEKLDDKKSRKLSDLKKSVRRRSRSPRDDSFKEKTFDNARYHRRISPDSLKSRSRSRSYSRRYRRYSRSRSRSKDKKSRYKYSRSRSSTCDKKYKDESDNPKERNKSRSRSVVSAKKSSPAVPEITRKEDTSGPNKDDQSTSRIIPRYYGRRKEDNSSSELSISSDEDASKSDTKPSYSSNNLSHVKEVGISSSQIKGKSESKLTPQERLKRKRQVLLKKQFKADKRAEEKKMRQMVQERIERAEEIKEISMRLRRRQLKMRHFDDSCGYYSSYSGSDASYGSYDDERSRSRRSRSPRSDYRSERTRRKQRHRSNSYSSRDRSRSDDRNRSRRRRDDNRRRKSNDPYEEEGKNRRSDDLQKNDRSSDDVSGADNREHFSSFKYRESEFNGPSSERALTYRKESQHNRESVDQDVAYKRDKYRKRRY